ncbi:unnamed protein product [Prorocentrum cordatum]|uniref:Glycoside hydrolase family 31 N-terminal domain-containing protein n=1 Tax=Prorocentrum cordatum TaxID=2364126 RepID=A0ABN9UNT6_9DINO|nr:unnamed protein product [Polarella glacialis]
MAGAMGHRRGERTPRLLAASALLVALPAASAVDASKFRTCEQGSFCRRYRKYVERISQSGEYAHLLDPGSIALEGQTLHAKILSTAGTSPRPLQLRASFFKDGAEGSCGIARLSIREDDAGLYPRFQVREGDVVVAGLVPDEVTLTTSLEDGTSLLKAAGPGDCSLLLRHRPLEVAISAGGHVLQRLNERHLLNYEQYRARADPPRGKLVDATDVDAEGLWEESFGDFVDTKPRGPAAVGLDVSFESAPTIVGLAEHTASLHLAKPRFAEPYRLFNLDVFEYEVNVPASIYGNIPFVTAVHVWPGEEPPSASGFMIVNPSEGFVKVDGPKAEAGRTSTWWAFESGILDMFSFAGPSPQQVLQQYHSVTGLPRMPLLASLGKHQSRWNYVDVDDVIKVDMDFDKHSIPYDFIWLDLEHTEGKKYFTWDPKHFADPGRMMDRLGRSGRKVVTIVDPHLKGDDAYVPYLRMKEAGVFTRGRNGTEYEGFCWPGPSYYPDFCDPAARRVWAELFSLDTYPHSRQDLYTWNDMNEPSVFDGPEISMPRDNLHKCHGNDFAVEHRDMHNLYGFYHHQATVEGQLLRAPDLRPFALTRSFFAGSHRHGAVWTGDNHASWEHLAASVPMLVSLSLCGMSLAGADVPGFMGDPGPDLFLRWHQLGIWYPFYRGHAHLTTKRREPWLFGDQITTLVRSAVSERYKLLPMWYTLMAEWSFFGVPVLRPLWYHNLSDPQSYRHADDHYLVGEALLVRAVAQPEARKLEVYLPPGAWFDYWDESAPARSGGEAVVLAAHDAHVPVFVRSGNILVKKGRPRRSTAAMFADPYTVCVFGAAARGRLYVDDGSSHQYSSGSFIYDELEFDGSSLRASPSSTLSSKGAPAVPAAGLRVERVVFVGLPRAPAAARLVRHGGGASQVERELEVAVERGADGGAGWRAVVKDPKVTFGAPHDWSIELTYYGVKR